MDRPSEPLRGEHGAFVRRLDDLLAVADGVDERDAGVLLQQLQAVHSFFATELIPHTTAEDRVLYPLVDGLLGAPGATGPMHRDHIEIVRLTWELGVLRDEVRTAGRVAPSQIRSLRRVLYGLHAVALLHLAEEEELYLALIDERLSEDAAAALAIDLAREAEIAARELGG